MPLYTDGSPHDHIELLSHRCVSRLSFCSQTLLGLTIVQEVFHRHRRSTTVAHNTTLLPSVNTFGRGMFCGAKYTHHTFSPIIKESLKQMVKYARLYYHLPQAYKKQLPWIEALDYQQRKVQFCDRGVPLRSVMTSAV